MLRSLLFILTLGATVLAAGTACADVYKFKDDKGNVLYTDKPSTLPAERIDIESHKTDVVALKARQDAEQQRRQSAQQARQQADAASSEQQQAAQMTAQDKAEHCTKARERYDKYMTSQRLYEPQPDGGRRYLTSEELDAARASAKATMDVMCQ